MELNYKDYYFFTEMNGPEHVQYFRIPRNAVGYRQGISLSGFINLMHKHCPRMGRWFYFKDGYNFEIDIARYKEGLTKYSKYSELTKLYTQYLNLPVIECIDLYDFYDKIKFNRKTRKFE